MKACQRPRRSIGWTIALLCLLCVHTPDSPLAATNQTVFAVVTALTGWAIARSTDGKQRELAVGSELYPYEIIITRDNTRLVANGPDGIIELQGKQVLTLRPAGARQRKALGKFGGLLGGKVMDKGIAQAASKPSPKAAATAAQPSPVAATGGHLLSAREFLFSGQAEASGYPLYSYLLFNREDLEGSVYQRRIAAVQGYLQLLPPVKDVSADIAKEDINIFYLPLKASLPGADPAALEAYVAKLKPNSLAKHILDNYDFSHARVLLHRSGLEGDGPFIVTAIRPLSKNSVKPDETVLTQDLSHVPPELVKLWVQQFKYEAARWRTGESTTLRKFALHLRTEISVLAEAFRITNEAVAAMIKEGDATE